MIKQIGKQNAQITLVNLLVILMVMIIWFVFLPVVINFTNNSAVPAIATSTADQPTKDIETALVQLFPVVVTIMIIISALNYAIPRREGY